MSWPIYFYSLVVILLFAFLGWLLSLIRRNVTHVDSMWSLFFVLAALTTAAFVLFVYPAPARLILVLALQHQQIGEIDGRGPQPGDELAAVGLLAAPENERRDGRG